MSEVERYQATRAALQKLIEARIAANVAAKVIDELTGFDALDVQDMIESLAQNSLRVGAATDADISAIINEMHDNADIPETEANRIIQRIAVKYCHA